MRVAFTSRDPPLPLPTPPSLSLSLSRSLPLAVSASDLIRMRVSRGAPTLKGRLLARAIIMSERGAPLGRH